MLTRRHLTCDLKDKKEPDIVEEKVIWTNNSSPSTKEMNLVFKEQKENKGLSPTGHGKSPGEQIYS